MFINEQKTGFGLTMNEKFESDFNLIYIIMFGFGYRMVYAYLLDFENTFEKKTLWLFLQNLVVTPPPLW